MSTVFVSYATADVDFIEAVIAHAETRVRPGVKFFRANDPDSLKPGDRWRDRILLEMDRADVAVFFITPNSVARSWLNFELGYMAKSGTPMICVAAKNRDVSITHNPVSAYQLLPLNELPKLAAEDILRFVAPHMPAPARRSDAIQIGDKVFPLDLGWQRYVFSGTKTEMRRVAFGTAFGKTFDDDGFRYPASQDTLTAPWEFLALRANPELPVHVYFVVELTDGELVKLYVNSTQDTVGFGIPNNEFQIPVPTANRAELMLIDVASFVPRMGRQPRVVKGMRVRGPTELACIGMFETLATVPGRFKRREAMRIALPA